VSKKILGEKEEEREVRENNIEDLKNEWATPFPFTWLSSTPRWRHVVMQCRVQIGPGLIILRMHANAPVHSLKR